MRKFCDTSNKAVFVGGTGTWLVTIRASELKRKLEMSKHSDDLERLCNKLERRFGPQDVLFKQAQSELVACMATEQALSPRHDWSIPYRAFLKAQCDEVESAALH